MTERPGPPPIEPLSDVAWARVERGLWARLDTAPVPELPRRSRLWPLLAVPAIAAAAIAIVLLAIPDPGVAPPAPATAAAGDPLRVVSGAAPSRVTTGDASIELAAETALVESRDGTVVLERGGAW